MDNYEAVHTIDIQWRIFYDQRNRCGYCNLADNLLCQKHQMIINQLIAASGGRIHV